MTTIVKRYPTFEVDLITENTSYMLSYDTGKQLKQEAFEQALIQFTCINNMADDSPVFTLVILAKEKWDQRLHSNDLVRIRVIPDVTKGVPDNPYIMVGLISDVHKEGEFSDGTLLYRITGQAMTKALISFDVGVIQEVATIIPSIGWLPDGTQNGLKFSGNTAAGIGNELMDRFIYKYAQYNFSNGMKLKDYFFHSFSSWEKDENLSDPTPFINYQGSLRQFLEDVSAKPFNELFFEYTAQGQCVALMRPTPFDPDKWYQLPTYRFTSDIVTQESYGKNDNEMYSVYIVNVPNILDFNSMDLGVYPKFHPELIKKYGYKRLDADNRYLLTSGAAAALDSNSAATDASGDTPPSYNDLVTFVTQSGYVDPETLRKKRNDVYSAIKGQYSALSKATINAIIDDLKSQTLSQENYNTILATNGDGKASKAVNKEKNVASEKLDVYTQRLFNWYCENANFYSGDIRVLGNPAYRIGTRVLYDDFEEDTTWEFYLESVQHEFSFTTGYTTILGLTRGLPNSGNKRFSNLWGQSQDFKGGYLGEMSLSALVNAAAAQKAPSDANVNPSESTWGNATGGNIAMKALSTAEQLTHQSSVYVFGGGRTGKNPFFSSPIRCDCSSFVWWCYNTYGVGLNGGKTGMTTDTIARDSRLTTVSTRGTSKQAAMNILQQGDLIWFDTYKSDGHIGIYAGNGEFIACNSTPGISKEKMTSGYFWNHFNGHVARYTG